MGACRRLWQVAAARLHQCVRYVLLFHNLHTLEPLAAEDVEVNPVANAPTAPVDYEARCAAAAALALLAVKEVKASDALARAAVSRVMTSPWAGTREAACCLLEALAAANRAAWRLPVDCITALSTCPRA